MEGNTCTKARIRQETARNGFQQRCYITKLTVTPETAREKVGVDRSLLILDKIYDEDCGTL